MTVYTEELPEAANDAYGYSCEGVLIWDASASQKHPPYDARLITQNGVHAVASWVDRPWMDPRPYVFKVRAVVLNPDNRRLQVVNVQDDPTMEPLELLPPDWCPIPKAIEQIYDLTRTIESQQLAQLLRDVFSHQDVFQKFWTATAGCKHHAWPGGLAWHSLEVAQIVAKEMQSDSHPVRFSAIERDLGLVAALLHDVGKTISYNQSGYCTERALTVGHELLGLELIRKPLDNLRNAEPALADSLTALLLSRTRFACSQIRLEAIREVVSRADRNSARWDTVPF